MAFALSCTLSDRIAAVGVVAAAQLLPFSWCTDQRPVPMIAFHGTADPIVPYTADRRGSPPAPFPDVRGRRAGPEETSADRTRSIPWSPRTSRASNTRTALTSAAVVLYTIQGGGHAWPGGKPLPEWWVGPTSHEIDATG